MVDTNQAAMVNLLVTGYDELKSRLTRRLGSSELAGEALQDTYLRLNTIGNIQSVQKPQAYLFRVALSVATTRLNAERRRRTEFETDAYFDFVDATPDPARIVEGRSEIVALKRAMMELPVRRRQILVAACMDETPHHNIAQRFSVTVRTIQIELKQAITHCALRLDQDVAERVRLRRRRASQSNGTRTT